MPGQASPIPTSYNQSGLPTLLLRTDTLPLKYQAGKKFNWKKAGIDYSFGINHEGNEQ